MTKRLLVGIAAALCMLAAPALLAPAKATPHVDVVQPSRVTHVVHDEVALLTH